MGLSKHLITAARMHCGINWAFREHTPTHSRQNAYLIARGSLTSDRTHRRRKTNYQWAFLRDVKANKIGIAAIVVHVMMP